MARTEKPYKKTLICLLGPDGAGKSSIAKLLAAYFSHKGFRVRISWMRGTHTIASVLARFLGLFENLRAPDNPYYMVRVPKTLHELWIVVEVLSVLPVWLIKYVFPSKMGYVVVGDRGLVDFVVWLAMILRRPKLINSIVSRAVLALSRASSAAIYVRASREELIKRRGGEENLVELQLALYDAIARAYKLPIINTTCKSVSESCREALSIILGGNT